MHRRLLRGHHLLWPTSARIRLVWITFSEATCLRRRSRRRPLRRLLLISSALPRQPRRLLLTTSPRSAILRQHQRQHQWAMILRISVLFQALRQRQRPH